MKRFAIHIGVMSVCLVVLLAVIFTHAGAEKSAMAVSSEPADYSLTDRSLVDGGLCPMILLTAEGRTDDGTPLLMVYYQYTLRSVGEAACEIDVHVQDTPRSGYTPLLCSPEGSFSICIPIGRMKRVETFFQGKNVGKSELFNLN